jgi:hypothetical protein
MKHSMLQKWQRSPKMMEGLLLVQREIRRLDITFASKWDMSIGHVKTEKAC